MQFETLMTRLTETHQALQHHARKTVDTALVLRNWLFGCYLVEYEQAGEDRATYGQRLIPEAARRLKGEGVTGMSATNLKLCRQLYLTYPQIGQSVTDQSLYDASLPALPEMSAADVTLSEPSISPIRDNSAVGETGHKIRSGRGGPPLPVSPPEAITYIAKPPTNNSFFLFYSLRYRALNRAPFFLARNGL